MVISQKRRANKNIKGPESDFQECDRFWEKRKVILHYREERIDFHTSNSSLLRKLREKVNSNRRLFLKHHEAHRRTGVYDYPVLFFSENNRLKANNLHNRP